MTTATRRIVPTAALIPAAGQAKLAYVNSAKTDIRVRFDDERAKSAKSATPGMITWLPSTWPGLLRSVTIVGDDE